MEQEHPFERQNRLLCEQHGAGTCPFCGGPPRLTGGGSNLWKVSCTQCHAEGPLHLRIETAVMAWNRRA
jgi:Restriction alleviation protein Lar